MTSVRMEQTLRRNISIVQTDKHSNAPAFIPAMFSNGVKSKLRTILMLNIWTPPPDM